MAKLEGSVAICQCALRVSAKYIDGKHSSRLAQYNCNPIHGIPPVSLINVWDPRKVAMRVRILPKNGVFSARKLSAILHVQCS